MPATPKHKLRTPLRRLRVLLGDRDAGVPMTQAEFAAKVGLSPQTVQALEYGTRALTESIQTLIAAKTHATWNPDDEQWRYLDTKNSLLKRDR
jgi:Predicted transcriptional regulators